jgi:hypothetical protein
MTVGTCGRQREVAEVLRCGQWPEGGGPELRAHVDGCSSCAGFVLVSEAFRRAREESLRAAPVESARIVWWRAQLRRRNAALERVERPMWHAQLFALSINLLVVAGFAAWQVRGGVDWRGWLPDLRRLSEAGAETPWSLASMSGDWSLVLLAAGVAAVVGLSGVVVYLSLERE